MQRRKVTQVDGGPKQYGPWEPVEQTNVALPDGSTVMGYVQMAEGGSQCVGDGPLVTWIWEYRPEPAPSPSHRVVVAVDIPCCGADDPMTFSRETWLRDWAALQKQIAELGGALTGVLIANSDGNEAVLKP